MHSDRSERALSTIGPSGERITLRDLPRPDTVRWVIRRKAELVAAIRGGLLTLEEACELYLLSEEELLVEFAGSARTSRPALYETAVLPEVALTAKRRPVEVRGRAPDVDLGTAMC
jgi:hypothetical protein